MLLNEIKEIHHIYYRPETKRRVVVPFRKGDLPKGTLSEILRQADVNKEELRNEEVAIKHLSNVKSVGGL